jgi:16S rRNA (guanine527-N7)-methyltransferase
MDKPLFQKYIELFIEANSKINLISKNDEKFIWEKHIYDCLSFEKFLTKYDIKDLKNKTLLDIGTGGGFPSVPLAIKYPELSVTALDSIKKKLNIIQSIKEDLGINNLSI